MAEVPVSPNLSAMPDDAAQTRSHWESVYADKAATEVSWYQRRPEMSLRMIHAADPAKDDRIVDVGGGASTLVDHLLDEGFRALSVLDLAESALAAARRRLGDRAALVDWIVQDVTAWRPTRRYRLWHDRAVLHFLTDEDRRAGYRAALEAGLAPGGSFVVATFAPEGPEKCSGLSVRRYSPADLAAFLGHGWTLEESAHEDHETPAGRLQRFTWCRFRRA